MNIIYTLKKHAFLFLLSLTISLAFADIDYKNLHSFTGGIGDGANPGGGLIVDDGTLYGMTSYGGSNNYGVVFKMNIDGSHFVTLHEFSNAAGDGGEPANGHLVLLGDSLYGMTWCGGTNDCGVIFKISTNGNNFSTLHEFSWATADGARPKGSLIAVDNVFYGMTPQGGLSNKGNIFKIDINGNNFNTIHNFPENSNDGYQPFSSLIFINNKLYGMTYRGGTNDLGIVFRCDINGANYTNIHSFSGPPGDGANPYDSLTFYENKLYGVTYYGGLYNLGAIFKMDINGQNHTNIYSFTDGMNNGKYPEASVIILDDVIYGTISDDAIFRIDINGENYSNIHNFTSADYSGYHPTKGALTPYNNAFYGMTISGGTDGKGVIFKQLEPEIPEPCFLLFGICFLLFILKKY